jgi:uncharacterized FAD-dependent dehydrogenase
MIHECLFRLLPEQAFNEQSIKQYIVREKGIKEITALRILKRSIDARKNPVYVNVQLRIYVNEQPVDNLYPSLIYGKVENKPQVIIVGAGPAGLFAALRLIELGLRPLIVERGKDVHERKKDIARISIEQTIHPESNYCFGEGGAGAYSDGKLYTRSKKRGNADKILYVFCRHGASNSILTEARPHIGTDKLPQIIENIRHTIIECGGEVYFQTRMDSLIIKNNEVKGIQTNTGKTFLGPVILATGHSARDVYRWLFTNGVTLEAKNTAMGIRLEHPAELIDQIQYHHKAGRGNYLPAAEYSFVTQSAGRGVYSFCMCPGGFVVPVGTEAEQIAVNGMSTSGRNSRWSNAGVVVEIHPEDFPTYAKFGELSLLCLQEQLERQSWLQGGRKQNAPAQRMVDFTQKKLGNTLPESSYTPGLVTSPLHFWLPESISNRLSESFIRFGKLRHGFLTNEATVIGVETRTSSAVRIPRDKKTMQHIKISGLFPCGEGAGYAGGIVSAGIDGERCAEAATAYLQIS